MLNATISLFKESYRTRTDLAGVDSCHGTWIKAGTIVQDGVEYGAGKGIFLPPGSAIHPGQDGVEILRFAVSGSRPVVVDDTGLLLSRSVTGVSRKAVLRLDSVVFPPRAVAYLHVHPGPGIRCLIRGALEINSDGHVKTMSPGDCWFEDTASPVEATASKTETTQFVRAHILPLEYEGKPTIKYLRSGDEKKPKLQENYRFFDRIIELPA